MRKKELVITTMMIASMMLLTACSGCGKEEEPDLEPAITVETMVEETVVSTEVEEIVEATIEEVEATTVEEVETETVEEVAEIKTMYAKEALDIYKEANEESEVLESVEINYAFSVVSQTEDGIWSEVVKGDSTAFVKTELLSDLLSQIEVVDGKEVENTSISNLTEEGEVGEVPDIDTSGGVVISDGTADAKEPVPAPAPQTPSSEVQSMIDAIAAGSGGLIGTPDTEGNFAGGGSSNFHTDKEIVLH